MSTQVREQSDAGVPASPVRRASARRAMPGPRAVVGALLITVAAVGVLAAFTAAEDGAGQTYVVADRDLAVGTRIDPSALREIRADLPADTQVSAFGSVDDLAGAITLSPVGVGEMIQHSAVTLHAAPDEQGAVLREFSFAIDRDRAVNGKLRRGEVVDVLATYGTGETASTSVAARGAVVRSVDDGQGASLGSTGVVIVTLAFGSPDEVLALAHASEVAAVTIVRSTGAAEQPLPLTYQPATTAP